MVGGSWMASRSWIDDGQELDHGKELDRRWAGAGWRARAG